MKMLCQAGIFTTLAIVFLHPPLSTVPDDGYKLIKSYALKGAGGWDSITLDPSARRLYLSHTAQVHVVDADRGSLVGDIGNLQVAHGTVLIKELDRGFISDGGADKVVIFSLQTLRAIGEVKTGGNPDCIIYDPSSRHIFTFNGRTHDSTVINPAEGTVLATIPMGGRPEFAVADGKGTIYVNIRDTNEVAALDSRTLLIKSRWPIAPAAMPTAITMDEEHRLLFIGGRNKVFAIMDADSGKIIQTFPIDSGVDTNIYDPIRNLVFSSDREGTIHIFHEDSPSNFSVVETVTTQPGAHTMALDPKTTDLFLDTADFDRGTVPESGGKTPVPNVFDHPAGGFHSMGVVRPGTFRLLVYGR
jgi:DNA-binding beta-propeller fold protein YncE